MAISPRSDIIGENILIVHFALNCCIASIINKADVSLNQT